ncbi:MAG: right-handed parallel beta-helix repeat-containing protein [Verrucomicrobiota bacterium]
MRSSCFSYLRLGCILTLTFISAMDGAEPDFIVATNGNDGWSGKAFKTPASKSDGPFATLQRARDAVRQLKAAEPGRKRPIVVQIHGGTYWLADTLVLEAADSGTDAAPIVYEGAPGEEVLLSGGTQIAGWREVSAGRWETQLPTVASGEWNFSQLYVNNQRRARPVVPRDGYFFVAAQVPPSTGQGHDRFRFHPGDLRADWHNLPDVEVTTFHLWTMDRLHIKTVDAEQNLVTFTGPTHSTEQGALKPSTWYRVENVKEALQPGEWYLDRKSGVLTLLARAGENVATAQVIAPRLPQVVRFQGSSQAPVSNITLRTLTLAHNAWNTPARGWGHPQADASIEAAITARFAQRCAIEQCVIRHTATYGVDWSDGCHQNRVEGCELYDLGAGGVKVGPSKLGWEPDTNKWSSTTIIRDNLIAHGGRIFPPAVGIWIGHAWSNDVSHNHVFDFYYSAVSVGWKWGPGFSPAHHNLIYNNHLHDIGQGVLSDMAGIYTLGESPGTRLQLNRIHDVSSVRYGGWGIYFDESSSNIVADCNLVYHTKDAGLHQHYGNNNTVTNNIFAFGTNGQIRLSNPAKSGPILIAGNIFYYNSSNLFELDRMHDRMEFRRNVYWREGGPVLFTNRTPIETWRLREPDALVADPGFKAPHAENFELATKSPAIKAGFQPFDISKAGRLTRHDRTASLPAVTRVFPPGPPEPPKPVNVTIRDDFEMYAPGQPIMLFTQEKNQGDILKVINTTAANGKQALQFTEGTGREPAWRPHIYTHANFANTRMRATLALRVEPGAQLNYEWRDWPNGGKYAPGPSLTVKADGTLTANGTKITQLPTGQWVKLNIECGIGDKATGTYQLQVTLPGQPPITKTDLHYQSAFKTITWVGICSFGEVGTTFYVDDFLLEAVK